MAISAGVSAGGSLLSGVLGSKGASAAAAKQAQADQNVANLATTAAGTAATGVTSAANTGATNIAGATATGTQGIASGVNNANSTLQNYLTQQQSQYAPYQQAGATSLGQIQQLTNNLGSQQFSGPTVASLNDPNNPASAGYQFTLQQGQEALQRQAAASGSLFSTGTAKSLANYTTGAANQYFQNSYNNALSTFNANQQTTLNQIGALQGLAGLGSSAAAGASNAIGSNASQQSSNTLGGATTGAQLGLSGTEAGAQTSLAGATSAGQFGLQGAQIAGSALTNQGNAQAAGVAGSTNSWINALNGGTNALGQYVNYNNQTSVANMGGGLANIPSATAPGTSYTGLVGSP